MASTDSSNCSQQPQLPPGFRFHPTDEELVVHYLKKRIASIPLPVSIIAEIDLYKFDPWELPDKAIFGEQEWYFFSPRDRKYPNGARPNRAATSGYWKATGTDKPVLTAGGTQKVGVKKALVFYRGKPPKGIKTNWIMHEYRLTENKPNIKPPGCDFGNKKGSSLRLDDWVLCRIYKKINTQRPVDQERDDDMSCHDMIGSTHPTISSSSSSMQPPVLMSYLNETQALYNEALMNNEAMNNSHLGPKLLPMGTNFLHGKRPFNPYWNDQEGNAINVDSSPTKRFISENCDGSIGRTDDHQTSNSIETMISHLPQQQMLGSNLGEGVYRLQQQYHQNLTWY